MDEELSHAENGGNQREICLRNVSNPSQNWQENKTFTEVRSEERPEHHILWPGSVALHIAAVHTCQGVRCDSHRVKNEHLRLRSWLKAVFALFSLRLSSLVSSLSLRLTHIRTGPLCLLFCVSETLKLAQTFYYIGSYSSVIRLALWPPSSTSMIRPLCSPTSRPATNQNRRKYF